MKDRKKKGGKTRIKNTQKYLKKKRKKITSC